MPDDLHTSTAGVTQQDFSVIQGAVAALRLMIDNRSIPLSDIAADVGIAYQRFATGNPADMEAAVKAIAKAKSDFNTRVSSWQRDVRAAVAGAPKTLTTKLNGQLQTGTGRAHNLANSFDMLIARLEECRALHEHRPLEGGENTELARSEEEGGSDDEGDSALGNAPTAAEQAPHDRIPAKRTVLSENGLVLAEVLTDRPAHSGEPGVRVIAYRVNNITTIGDVVRDDREPEWLPTEYGKIKRPVIGSIPFAVGSVTGTVAGEYKVTHIEVRPSFRSDVLLRHGIRMSQQVREGNILYVFLARRD